MQGSQKSQYLPSKNRAQHSIIGEPAAYVKLPLRFIQLGHSLEREYKQIPRS